MIDGNSQSRYTPYPTELARLTNQAVDDYAVNSQTTLQMIADAATEIDPTYAHDRPNILIAAEVRNDLVDGGRTPRQAVNSFWTYCDARRAAAVSAGVALRIVVWNILPSGEGAPQNARYDEANGYLAAEWATHADAFVDIRSDARLTDPNNFTYFNTDHLHLTAEGARIQAGLIYPALAL